MLPATDTTIADPETRETEDHWVARVRQGDTVAFEKLYRRHGGRVFALCLRMSSNRAVAEELTQETFIRAWQQIGKFRGDSRFGTWLYRIAANLTLSQLRSRKPESGCDWIDELAGETALVGHSDHQRDLERGMTRLPDGARSVLVLHDIAGFAHKEIGDMLGVATGTCKAQLHRARKLMREYLES